MDLGVQIMRNKLTNKEQIERDRQDSLKYGTDYHSLHWVHRMVRRIEVDKYGYYSTGGR